MMKRALVLALVLTVGLAGAPLFAEGAVGRSDAVAVQPAGPDTGMLSTPAASVAPRQAGQIVRTVSRLTLKDYGVNAAGTQGGDQAQAKKKSFYKTPLGIAYILGTAAVLVAIPMWTAQNAMNSKVPTKF
jgi:hypothetical protein